MMMILWMEEGKGFWRLGRRSVVRPWFNDHYRNQFDAWFSEKLIRKRFSMPGSFICTAPDPRMNFVSNRIFLWKYIHNALFFFSFPLSILFILSPKSLMYYLGHNEKKITKNILEIEIIFWKNVPSNLLKWNFLLKKDLKIAKKI